MEEKENFIYQPPFPGHSRQSHHRPLFAMNWSKVVINRPKTIFYIDKTSTNCVTWLFKVKRFTSLHIYIYYIYRLQDLSSASTTVSELFEHPSKQEIAAPMAVSNWITFVDFLSRGSTVLSFFMTSVGENGGQRPRLLNNTIGNRNMETSTSLQQP